MFPLYLQYLLIDFRQTFVTGASWDTDDLFAFLGQKVKVQGHTIAAEAHSTRRNRRVQLFLVFISFATTSPSSADRRETLPHDRNLVHFITQVQKFRGPPPKMGAQIMQNFGQFHTTSDFDREYLRNGSRYPKSES